MVFYLKDLWNNNLNSKILRCNLSTVHNLSVKKIFCRNVLIDQEKIYDVNQVLDKTNLDEKLVAKYNENPGLYNSILCYTKCYGGYVLAVGAGTGITVNANDVAVAGSNSDLSKVRHIHIGIFAVLYRFGLLGLLIYFTFNFSF